VIPIIIAREYSAHRAHTMTGVYTSALNVGTMTVTLATAPLSGGIGWRWAVLFWAVFGLAALVVWLPLRGLRAALVPHADPRPANAEGSTSVLRHGPTWLLAAAFAGQAFAFYAMTAWLPTLLADQGFSGAAAGAISAIFQVAGIAGSLLLPLVTLRASLRVGAIAAGVAWLAVPLGFLFAPGLWLVWCALGGMAQGAGITIVFIMINGFGDDAHTTAGRSGFVQGFGYAVAAIGPLLLGALHEATDAWVLPLVVVLVAVVLFLVAGVAVATHIQRLRRTSNAPA
jgi:MFS transporter, CP family, cyanate transporter